MFLGLVVGPEGVRENPRYFKCFQQSSHNLLGFEGVISAKENLGFHGAFSWHSSKDQRKEHRGFCP